MGRTLVVLTAASKHPRSVPLWLAAVLLIFGSVFGLITAAPVVGAEGAAHFSPLSAGPGMASQPECTFVTSAATDPSLNWTTDLIENPLGIPYFVDEEIADSEILGLVFSAAREWEEATAIRFLYAGSTAAKSTDADYRNVIGPAELPFFAGGFAQIRYIDRKVAEFDIQITKGVVAAAIEDPASVAAERFRLTLLHEFGHVVGLGHTATAGQIMQSPSEAESLGGEDRACAASIYGEPDAPPTVHGDADVLGNDTSIDVSHVVTCLAGNGRVDTNIVNTRPQRATYRVTFEGLSAREALVQRGDWWRVPITGRADGSYLIEVTASFGAVSTQRVVVKCDEPTVSVNEPDVQIVNACRDGFGYVLFQFANNSAAPRGYVIDFGGVPNRSTTAAPWAGAVRAVTGRPSGTYPVTIRADGRVSAVFQVAVSCD